MREKSLIPVKYTGKGGRVQVSFLKKMEKERAKPRANEGAGVERREFSKIQHTIGGMRGFYDDVCQKMGDGEAGRAELLNDMKAFSGGFVDGLGALGHFIRPAGEAVIEAQREIGEEADESARKHQSI